MKSNCYLKSHNFGISMSLTLLLRRVKLGKVLTTPPSTITVYPVK